MRGFFLSDWPLSTITCHSLSMLLQAESDSIVYIYYDFLIHWSAVGNLGCFHSLVIIVNAIIKVFMHPFKLTQGLYLFKIICIYCTAFSLLSRWIAYFWGSFSELYPLSLYLVGWFFNNTTLYWWLKFTSKCFIQIQSIFQHSFSSKLFLKVWVFWLCI